jgi:hypothetical protein
MLRYESSPPPLAKLKEALSEDVVFATDGKNCSGALRDRSIAERFLVVVVILGPGRCWSKYAAQNLLVDSFTHRCWNPL